MGKKHWGIRTVEECIDSINQFTIDYESTPLEDVYRCVSPQHGNVPTRTLRRWYDHYLEWGEYPHVTKANLKAYKKIMKSSSRTNVITDEIVATLKDIVDEAPELYIDKIAEELGNRTGVYLSHSTVHATLTTKLNYSLQVCYESAKQRNELERERYRHALKCLVARPEQVIVVDKTHKDKKALRKRRAWGKMG